MDIGERHLGDAAVEALGGTPRDVRRPSSSPLGWVLPPGARRRIAAFDRAADRGFDRLRGRRFADRLFYAASTLGDFSLLWHLISTARALRSERNEKAALRLGAALLVETVVVNAGVKSLFRRARPAWVEERSHRLRRPRSSSFPSGHATSGFMAATLLADTNRSLPRLWYGVAAIVAASRVHVRIHHASDVVGGTIVGLGFGRLTKRLWPLPT